MWLPHFWTLATSLYLIVMLAIEFQFGKIVFIVVLRQECQLHQPRMHHQEHQHVHGPMPSIVELLVLNRAGDRPAKGLMLQNLESRDLIDTNDPDALFRQSLRIPIAPKDLLRSLFEPGIQTGRLPISGAMGLQINIVQQPANRCRTDRANDAVLHSLTSQVLAGPMADVQAHGNWFQTGQFHDLRSLHRCNLLQSSRTTFTPIGQQPLQAIPAIAFTGSPNGRYAAFLNADFRLRLPAGEPRFLATRTGYQGSCPMSGCVQTVFVGRGKGQHARLTTTHRLSPSVQKGTPTA